MSHQVISTILRHDGKQTSYKIALLRALNDVVLAYPDVTGEDGDVAVPLRMLAEAWVAYYWPFVAPEAPVMQGVRSLLGYKQRQDVGFRANLAGLRLEWEAIYGPSGSAGGWHLTEHLRVARKREGYPQALLKRYQDTLTRVGTALRQPIRYAGPGEWSVFEPPRPLRTLSGVAALPGARPSDTCLVVRGALWQAFRDVSLWVEALCIHEWSQFTERVSDGTTRGVAYALLTERPDNRLPLDWERNQVDLLMLEGARFECPWTGGPLARGAYDLDHIVPLSVYPFHEVWNLVPSNAAFNRNTKRARLPADGTMVDATPRLVQTYTTYASSSAMAEALRDDVAVRFSRPDPTPALVAESVRSLVESIGTARNVARF
ncbi:MAG: hypothetical protein EA416_17440 [Trueperaceae bacterium]|nr:MAG: hypothetical protein EA416_17440 [Trueperaceae bacterium]